MLFRSDPLAGIRCPGGTDAGDHCLSDAQMKTVNAWHTAKSYGFPLANGETTTDVAVHGGGILCSASDGKRVVMGSDDGKLVSVDAKSNVETLATDAKRRWIDNVALHPDGVVAWSAGKTAFVRGFARGIGYTGRVSSPSFALANEYQGGRLTIRHLDLCRLSSDREIRAAGLDEIPPHAGVLADVELDRRPVAALHRRARGGEGGAGRPGRLVLPRGRQPVLPAERRHRPPTLDPHTDERVNTRTIPLQPGAMK